MFAITKYKVKSLPFLMKVTALLFCLMISFSALQGQGKVGVSIDVSGMTEYDGLIGRAGGQGASIGVRYVLNLDKRFALESYLSHARYKDNSGLFSFFYKEYDHELTSLQLGFRFYLASKESKLRPSFNFLIGPGLDRFKTLTSSGENTEEIVAVGSTGFYLHYLNRVYLGLGMVNQGGFCARLGYSF